MLGLRIKPELLLSGYGVLMSEEGRLDFLVTKKVGAELAAAELFTMRVVVGKILNLGIYLASRYWN